MNHVARIAQRSPATSSTARTHAPDARWQCLRLVQRARAALQVKDREIAVLRGLISLIPADRWGQEMIVFASNRVIIDRCDGIDERTLRRRLVRLEERGLVIRRPSPNRKRYRVRDEHGAVLLSYGIDLTPLLARTEEIEDLAREAEASVARVRALKALLRHRLEEISASNEIIDQETCEEARLALRRNISAGRLSALLDVLSPTRGSSSAAAKLGTVIMSVDGGHNDRDIQSSEQEYNDNRVSGDDLSVREAPRRERSRTRGISINECVTRATVAIGLSEHMPRTWSDLGDLAKALAPAIGLDPQLVRRTFLEWSVWEGSVAILGLIQCHERIRSPGAYLSRLLEKAKTRELNFARMFRSLTRPMAYPQ